MGTAVRSQHGARAVADSPITNCCPLLRKDRLGANRQQGFTVKVRSFEVQDRTHVRVPASVPETKRRRPSTRIVRRTLRPSEQALRLLWPCSLPCSKLGTSTTSSEAWRCGCGSASRSRTRRPTAWAPVGAGGLGDPAGGVLEVERREATAPEGVEAVAEIGVASPVERVDQLAQDACCPFGAGDVMSELPPPGTKLRALGEVRSGLDELLDETGDLWGCVEPSASIITMMSPVAAANRTARRCPFPGASAG